MPSKAVYMVLPNYVSDCCTPNRSKRKAKTNCVMLEKVLGCRVYIARRKS